MSECAWRVEHECGLWVDRFPADTRGRPSLLTHYHVDHVRGLSDRWRGTLVCSPLTATQVLAAWPGMEVRWLPVDDGEWHPLDGSDGAEVSLVSCDHVVGSVCVCLRKGGRHYLHSGDLVVNDHWLRAAKVLFARLGMRRPDALFLDNTFDDAELGDMPDWDETAAALERFLHDHPGKRVHVVDHASVASSFMAEFRVEFRMSAAKRAQPSGSVLPHDEGSRVRVYARGDKVPRGGVRLTMSSLWFTCRPDADRTRAVWDSGSDTWRICLATHSDRRRLRALTRWLSPRETVECATVRSGGCPRLRR
jgi:hypothetical protein